MTGHPMWFIRTMIGFSVTLGLTGCEYWPPALQTEIEQLRSETHTLIMEKSQLEAQVADLSKSTQELQGHIDELSRLNREKTGMLTSLQNQLDATRAKALKAMARKAPAKPMAKATTRPTSKNTAKAAAHKSLVPRATVTR